MNKPQLIKVFNDSFVGIKYYQDQIYIYYPCALGNIDIDHNQESLLDFLRTLKYQNDVSELFSSRDGSGSPIDSILWILNDYIQNGFPIKYETKITHDSKSSINWKKSMKSLIIDDKEDYIDFYSNNSKSTEDELLKAYKYCLEESTKLLGFVFSLSPYYSGFTKNHTWSYLINKELTNTFQDKKRIRLFHMLTIVNGVCSDMDSFNEFTYGSSQYHTVYEFMLKETLGNDNEADYYSRGIWHLKSGNIFEAANLRPDFILKKDNIVFIMDAKYYQFSSTGETKDLPGSSDIQKQIYYANHVNKETGVQGLYSVFILPAKLKTFIEMEYFGSATIKNEVSNNPWETIHGFFVDLENLIIKFHNIEKIHFPIESLTKLHLIDINAFIE